MLILHLTQNGVVPGMILSKDVKVVEVNLSQKIFLKILKMNQKKIKNKLKNEDYGCSEAKEKECAFVSINNDKD